MMDCEKCQNGKPVDKEQLIQDLVDYLDYIGVTKESMIATANMAYLMILDGQYS